jgi:hypothetical protein
MSQELEARTSSESLGMEAGGLNRIEKRWTNRQKALEEAGYMLRPRYHPEWQPSWANTDMFFLNAEDGQAQAVSIKSLFSSPNR